MTYLLVAKVQELVELNAAVGEGAERPLLLEVGGHLGVGNGGISLASGRPFSIPPSYAMTLSIGSTHHLEIVVGGLAVGLEGWLLRLLSTGV